MPTPTANNRAREGPTTDIDASNATTRFLLPHSRSHSWLQQSPSSASQVSRPPASTRAEPPAVQQSPSSVSQVSRPPTSTRAEPPAVQQSPHSASQVPRPPSSTRAESPAVQQSPPSTSQVSRPTSTRAEPTAVATGETPAEGSYALSTTSSQAQRLHRQRPSSTLTPVTSHTVPQAVATGETRAGGTHAQNTTTSHGPDFHQRSSSTLTVPPPAPPLQQSTRAEGIHAQTTTTSHGPDLRQRPSSTFTVPPSAPPLQQSTLNHNRVMQSASPLQQSTLPQQPTPSHVAPRQHVQRQSSGPVHAQMAMLSITSRLEQLYARNDLTLVDRRILALIKEAVDESDIFYLILHQALMWKINSVEQNPVGQNHPVVQGGLRAIVVLLDATSMPILLEVLAIKSYPSPMLCFLLRDFPMNPSGLSQSDADRFQRTVLGVVACCEKLSMNWDAMIRFHLEHSNLPLAQDLEVNFGMSSRSLQRLTFLAVMRRCWKTTDSVPAQHAFSHFLQAQREFVMTGVIRDPTAHHLHYKHLFELHRRLHATGSQSAASPLPVNGQNIQNVQRRSLPSTQILQPAQGFPSTRSIPGSMQPNGPQVNGQNNQSVHRGSLPSTHNPPILPLASDMMQPSRQGPPAYQALYAVADTSGGATHRQREISNPHAMRSIPFIPPLGAPIVYAAQPDPTKYALHQAHLYGPKLVAKTDVLFRHMSGFALSPQGLTLQSIEEFRFAIVQEQVERLTTRDADDSTALVDSSTLSFRLRCCSPAAGAAWATADTTWPSYLYFTLNGSPLDLRRKLQHGRCLPVNLDLLVRTENVLKVWANLPSTVTVPDAYFIGVEVVEFSTKDALQEICSSSDRMRKAEEVRKSIVSSLSGANNDGDEVTILESDVTISLLEPFTNARICEVPIRGVDCTHREAFDLETFLDSRPFDSGVFDGKVTRVSEVDQWRCPICRGDARPGTWIVDGFLQQVRATLAASGTLDNVRSITVESSGVWKANHDTKDHEAVAGRGKNETGSEQLVIEIDSD